MLDRKYFTSTHVVLVLILIRVEFLKELVVHTRRLSMHRFARVVQNNKDTSRTLALNEITHCLVIKVPVLLWSCVMLVMRMMISLQRTESSTT